ncbi:MAG: hypothetical protein WD824_02765 [Cyclobacteriaceae bacterium]
MCGCDPPDLLSIISDIANIVMAFAGFALAFYVFVYQRRKDRESDRLQWFKDLIVTPNTPAIYSFFDRVTTIATDLSSPTLTDLRKSQILNDLKNECAVFRRTFVVLLRSVDSNMEKEIITNCIDQFLDNITQAAFDPNINLSNEAEFEAHVFMTLTHSRNYLLSRLFKFSG